MDKLASVHGGNPILFPFAGRSFVDGEMGKWVYEKKTLPMPLHGFAQAGDYELVDVRDSGFEVLLKPTETDLLAYPFKYEFSVVYRFQELSFGVEFRLKNLDDKIIPWSPGHHFYFNLPWNPGAERKDYDIRIPAKKAYYHA